MKGSITKIAHSPKTTEGIAVNSSTIPPIITLIFLGRISSVMKIAVPTPRGTAIMIDAKEVTNVPYIAVKAPYSSLTGFHSEVNKNLTTNLILKMEYF